MECVHGGWYLTCAQTDVAPMSFSSMMYAALVMSRNGFFSHRPRVWYARRGVPLLSTDSGFSGFTWCHPEVSWWS